MLTILRFSICKYQSYGGEVMGKANTVKINISVEILQFRAKFLAAGLGNYFVCKIFAVQTLVLSLEFVIRIILEHGSIAVNISVSFAFTKTGLLLSEQCSAILVFASS